jgi:hypothetical protein
MKDYYRILGVEPSASPSAIRKAWRRESFLWHPDRNPNRGPDAHSRFLDLSEAWAVLSDANQRREYDLSREDAADPPLPPWSEDLKAGAASGLDREPARPVQEPPVRRAGKPAKEARRSLRDWRHSVGLLAQDLARTDRRGRRLDLFMNLLWSALFSFGLFGFGYFLWRLVTSERTPGGYPLWTPLLVVLAAITVKVWAAAFRAHRVERYWPLAAEILERAGYGLHRSKTRVRHGAEENRDH